METVRKFVPLNFTLMAEPVNWLIVPVIVLLGGLALALVFHPANDEATSND